MQWLYRVVGQAGIFLICAQTIVHFRPKEAYEKYLKLLLSVMLLTQLLQPVLSVFGGGADQNVQAQVEEFTEELQSVLNRASERAKQSQEDIGNTAAAWCRKQRKLQRESPRNKRKRVRKMQKMTGSMWKFHRSGWNDGEVRRKFMENTGEKDLSQGKRKRGEKQWENSGKRLQAA